MRKLIKYIKENPGTILGWIILIIAFFCILVPALLIIGRMLWHLLFADINILLS